LRVQFSSDGWDDYLYWCNHDSDTHKRINALIESARRTPFAGLGKPEPLKGDYSGWRSRRITREHRLVYAVEGNPGVDQRLIILICRQHY
jgi:toxin YoeB